MKHFAYPNATDTHFIGCGRFLTWPVDREPPSQEYHRANPNARTLKEILKAAPRLAPELRPELRKTRRRFHIYEKCDQDENGNDWKYQGDSQGLAYLLALIHDTRHLRPECLPPLGDVWCTGVIEIEWGNKTPQVGPVDPKLFVHKLGKFISAPDDWIFFVPADNLIYPESQDLYTEADVRVLSLTDFRSDCYQPTHVANWPKTMVTVNADELPLLTDTLFEPPLTCSGYHVGKWIGVVLGLVTAGFIGLTRFAGLDRFGASVQGLIAKRPRPSGGANSWPVISTPGELPGQGTQDTRLLQIASAVASRLTIEAPRDGEVISTPVYDDMRGTYAEDLPSGHRLFVVARDHHNYFLMYPPPQVIRAMKHWSQTNIQLGSPGRWELHVCIANEAASQWLQARAEQRIWSGFPILPEGMEIVRYIAVERR
jgi:hypothetical protein